MITFFKKYRLRWIFYRKNPMWTPTKHHWQGSQRCPECKKAFRHSFWFINIGKAMCPHCKTMMVPEENTNFSYKAYLLWLKVRSAVIFILDKLHIVRRPGYYRYGLIGDEIHYIQAYVCDDNNGTLEIIYKKRKWYEYIFVKR